MDDPILDLENITILLTSVLQQLDRATLGQITAALDNRILEEMLLETLGVSRQRLSPEELERFTAVVESVLETTRRL